MKLQSVQIGKVKKYESGGESWLSAIEKSPVSEAIWARNLGLDGDEQSDHHHHGGEYQAINVYPAEHYDEWRKNPALAAMTGGAFGENFTTEGLLEGTICIGDVYQIGEAVVVSEPRQPCFKIVRRWEMADLKKQAEETGRYGWYFRVQKDGAVQSGDQITLLERPFPEWTVARVFELRADPHDEQAVRALSECAGLSPKWRAAFRKLIKED